MADFVQTLMTTLAVGSLYALIALGYTMVYGILKFINFAHSDIVVLGAWISYTLASRILPALGLDPHNPATPPPLWVGGGDSRRGDGLLAAWSAFSIERLAYRPLRRAPRLNVLITAIGVSLLLQNVGQLEFRVRAEPAEDAGACCRTGSCCGFRLPSGGGKPRRRDRPGRRDDLRHVGRADAGARSTSCFAPSSARRCGPFRSTPTPPR